MKIIAILPLEMAPTSVVILIHSIVLQGLFTQSYPYLFRLFGILPVNIIIMNTVEYEIQLYS